MAAEQGKFFGELWGPAARVLFLVIAGFFLMDSWLGGVDAVSRVHSEMLCAYSDKARAKGELRPIAHVTTGRRSQL